jgi:hypothetical protein
LPVALVRADDACADWRALSFEFSSLFQILGQAPQNAVQIGYVERVFNPDRKEHHWGRRKLARDR